MTCLKAYAWPGNIRQLENVIERAMVIVESPTITASELPLEVQHAANEPDEVAQPPDAFGIDGERAERARKERERLVRALAAANGNKTEAARALGLHRSTFVSRCCVRRCTVCARNAIHSTRICRRLFCVGRPSAGSPGCSLGLSTGGGKPKSPRFVPLNKLGA